MGDSDGSDEGVVDPRSLAVGVCDGVLLGRDDNVCDIVGLFEGI